MPQQQSGILPDHSEIGDFHATRHISDSILNDFTPEFYIKSSGRVVGFKDPKVDPPLGILMDYPTDGFCKKTPDPLSSEFRACMKTRHAPHSESPSRRTQANPISFRSVSIRMPIQRYLFYRRLVLFAAAQCRCTGDIIAVGNNSPQNIEGPTVPMNTAFSNPRSSDHTVASLMRVPRKDKDRKSFFIFYLDHLPCIM